MASSYANLLEQKNAFTYEKSSNPTGLVWDTNMAAVSLFWNTNMAAVTSCENALLCIQLFRERLSEKVHVTIPKGIVGGFKFTVL